MNEGREPDPATRTAERTSATPGTFVPRAVARVCVLAALAASTALYLQYLDPASAAFCGLESGCEAVRHASFAYFFGSRFLSIPLVGLLGFLSVLAASVWLADTAWMFVLATVGALAAVGLLVTQAFVVKAFCWLCVTADVAAVVTAVFAFLDRKAVARGKVTDPLHRWAWLALAATAMAIPVLWVRVKPAPPISPVIAALYTPNQVDVIEFADFECPYCRRFHATLKGVLHEYPADKIRFVRKHAPLPSHEEALPAARADVCAEQQKLGEKLADRLVDIELSAAANRRAAVEVGVDPVKFDACMASQVPDRQIDADSRLLEAAGMLGLPTTYIEGTRLLGAVSEVAVRDALDRALRGEENHGVPAPIFVPLSLISLLVVAWLGRDRRGTIHHERPS